MAADPSIYNALLQPVKSAQQYAEEYAAADDARARRRLNALQLQSAEQDAQDTNALRQYMRAAPDLGTPEGASGLYRVAPKLAGSILKDRAAMAKEDAQTKQAQAATASSEFDLNKKKLDFAWQGVASSSSPQAAQQFLQDAVQRGYMAPDQAQAELQRIPSDPQAFQQWRQQKAMSILSVKDQLEQQLKSRDFNLRASNELIGPDGQVNQPLFTAKKQLAQAGKTQVNLNVNTAKGLTGEMATGLGKQLDASLAGAQSAVNTINTADQIDSALSSGKLIIGPMADKRIVLARLGDALGVGGADNPEKLANTASLIQSLAKNELDAAQSMKGQGQITEAERALLRRASSGDINMSAPELQALTGALRKTAQRRIEQHQAQVNRLSSLEGAAPLIPFYQVDMPKPAQAGGGGVIRFDALGKRIN